MSAASRVAAACGLVGALAASHVSAQGSRVDAGHAIYARECGSCHGEAGTGYGPSSWVLRRRPADLTELARADRPFPRDVVRSTVIGRIRRVPASGVHDMPMWPRMLDATVATAEGAVTRIEALLDYLESLQREPYGSPPASLTPAALVSAGEPLYRLHCAGCHPSRAPDLTRLAAREGGELDLRVLYESIAHAHREPSEMPAWEDAFDHQGWPVAITQSNLTAIVRYVQSIQRR